MDQMASCVMELQDERNRLVGQVERVRAELRHAIDCGDTTVTLAEIQRALGDPVTQEARVAALAEAYAQHGPLRVEPDPTTCTCTDYAPRHRPGAGLCGREPMPMKIRDSAPAAAVDIVGGVHVDPGDTELDDAIEQIIGDYVPDGLLRAQLTQRVIAEVLRRTPIDDPYVRSR